MCSGTMQFRNGDQRKYAEEEWGSDLALNVQGRVGQGSKYCPLGPERGAFGVVFTPDNEFFYKIFFF